MVETREDNKITIQSMFLGILAPTTLFVDSFRNYIRSMLIVSNTTNESPLLPDDLITEILLRVPVRSLLRWGLVCKSWETLISNPQFVKQHYLATSTNMTHQQLICPILGEPFKMASCSVEHIFRYPPTPFNVTCFDMGDKFHILGSCHGLLWLFSVGLRYMKLCNLTMGTITSKTFPSPILRYSATFRGFGYDHLNDKYKLFLVVDSETETSAFGTNAEENPRKMTNIFTFGTNAKASSWKVIQDFPCDADAASDFYGKFVSGTGTLNWLVEKKESDVILSFDLASETYGEVLLPDGVGNMITIPQLVILSNCLGVSFFDSEKDHLVLWQMKEYGVQHSWTRLMVIPYFRLTLSPHHEDYNLNWFDFVVPLCISEDGVLMLKTKSKLVLYNPHDGSWDLPIIDGFIYKKIQTYHQSLVSVLF
ncbi:hypothetical protein Fmac_014339 [Flemingia macrophylla]|uniref:F-box domain-containing protein n=1 Tax=Flemingia macrophylla TaxID=520843 RepID=A0ABD1MBG3_9FABA